MSGRISNKIVTDGLVLYLDAGNTRSYVSGATAWNDLSKNASTGVLTNGPTYDSSNGGSIAFDGIDDYVDFGTTNIILPTNITLCAWINQSTLSGYKNIITKEGATQNDLDYGLTTASSGNLYFWFDNSGYSIHETTNNPINSINTWYNTVVVFNDLLNTVQIYVNGVEMYNQSETDSLISHSNSKLFIGWRNSLASNQSFDGKISNTIIYNRALTPTKVLQNYNALKGRFGL